MRIVHDQETVLGGLAAILGEQHLRLDQQFLQIDRHRQSAVEVV